MVELFIGLVKTGRGRLILSGILTVLGTLWIFVGWSRSSQATRLSRSRSFAIARITAVKPYNHAGSFPYVEVQYRFDLPGHAGPLTNREAAELMASWSKIPTGDWREIERTNQVRIVYLPEQPEVNLPQCGLSLAANHGNSTIRFGIVAILIGGFGLAWRIFRRMQLQPADPWQHANTPLCGMGRHPQH